VETFRQPRLLRTSIRSTRSNNGLSGEDGKAGRVVNIRAWASGVKFGRKLKLKPHQRQEAIARREAGETLLSITRSYNVHWEDARPTGAGRRHSAYGPDAASGKLPCSLLNHGLAAFLTCSGKR
jgi:hypothetical protein